MKRKSLYQLHTKKKKIRNRLTNLVLRRLFLQLTMKIVTLNGACKPMDVMNEYAVVIKTDKCGVKDVVLIVQENA